MIILHFHVQPQFIYELFHINFTSIIIIIIIIIITIIITIIIIIIIIIITKIIIETTSFHTERMR